MIERLQANSYISQQVTKSKQNAGTAFSDLLRQRMENVGSAPTVSDSAGIAFSKHAQQRVQERGIEISSDLLAQLTSSVLFEQSLLTVLFEQSLLNKLRFARTVNKFCSKSTAKRRKEYSCI